jgi:hypothetical protein
VKRLGRSIKPVADMSSQYHYYHVVFWLLLLAPLGEDKGITGSRDDENQSTIVWMTSKEEKYMRLGLF